MAEYTPSKIRPWLVWGSAGLFAMYQFLLQGSPSVIIPELMASFGIDTEQVAFLTTTFFYSYILMQIPSGILVDLFGPKLILLIGCISAATACIIFSNCHELWLANSSRLLMGLMCAPGFVATLTLASRWFDRKRFALVVGFTETLAMIGAAIGAILLAITAHHLGWRSAILFCGIIGYFVALLILFIVRNNPPTQNTQRDSIKKLNLFFEVKNLWIVLKSSQSWLSGIYAGLIFAMIPAFFALWAIPYFMHTYQIDSPKAASITALGYAGAGLGGPFVGWISGRIQRRKIIMTISSLLAVFTMSCIIYIDLSMPSMYLFSFLLGSSISSYVIPFAVVGDILPNEARGKAMGFTNCLTLLIGAPILQPLMGKFLKTTKAPMQENFTPALNLLLISLVLAFFLSFFIKETYCQTKTSS